MESVCCTMNESEFIAQILHQEMRTKYVEKNRHRIAKTVQCEIKTLLKNKAAYGN